MSGRTVIVTGGFGVLGRAVAAAFAASGDRVVRVDYAPAPNDAGPDDLGGIDLSDPGAAKAAMDRISAQSGRPSVLVNVAGGFVWEMLADGGPATWERMFRMNTMTAVSMCYAALPFLREAAQAAIVNIGAGAAGKAAAGMGSYAASKSGVHRLTESLAEEVKGSAVRVNAILPSIIDTPTNRADMPDADTSDWVQPEAIAKVALFLASSEACAINGALIPVTRGG